MLKTALAALTSTLLLLSAGCSKDKKSSSEGDKPKGDDPPAATKVETEKPDPKPTPAAAVTLVSVSQGDMGCYVEVEDASGETKTHMGGFDLCPEGEADASGLEGQKVVLTMGKEEFPAESCMGDPECEDTEEVEVVTAIAPEPVDGDAVVKAVAEKYAGELSERMDAGKEGYPVAFKAPKGTKIEVHAGPAFDVVVERDGVAYIGFGDKAAVEEYAPSDKALVGDRAALEKVLAERLTELADMEQKVLRSAVYEKGYWIRYDDENEGTSHVQVMMYDVGFDCMGTVESEDAADFALAVCTSTESSK